jgi:hypothetical protein
VRWIVGIALLGMAAACGGKPVGSKIPKADPKKVAVGAAAAATVLTLANPDLAGKQPESDEQRELRGKKLPKETVPGDVLDRAGQGGGGDDELPPCPKEVAKPVDGSVPGGVDFGPKKPAVPCRKVEPKESDDDADAGDDGPSLDSP